MNNDIQHVTFAFLVVICIIFVITLISSWLTILSINVLFAKEIITLSIESVFALAWVKFMITGLLSGIVRITHQEVKK